MSTLEILLKHYGIVITLEQLVPLIGMKSIKAAQNAVSAQSFPIPTYRSGKRRVADARDVAEYLDKCRDTAHRDFDTHSKM
jgi:hypothetical protein